MYNNPLDSISDDLHTHILVQASLCALTDLSDLADDLRHQRLVTGGYPEVVDMERDASFASMRIQSHVRPRI